MFPSSKTPMGLDLGEEEGAKLCPEGKEDRLQLLLSLIGTLLDLVSALLDLLGAVVDTSLALGLGSLGSGVELLEDPLVGRLDVVSDLSEDGLGRSRGAVLEVRVLLAGVGAKLVRGGTLGDGLLMLLARDTYKEA